MKHLGAIVVLTSTVVSCQIDTDVLVQPQLELENSQICLQQEYTTTEIVNVVNQARSMIENELSLYPDSAFYVQIRFSCSNSDDREVSINFITTLLPNQIGDIIELKDQQSIDKIIDQLRELSSEDRAGILLFNIGTKSQLVTKGKANWGLAVMV
jgi:hypothetical protein